MKHRHGHRHNLSLPRLSRYLVSVLAVLIALAAGAQESVPAVTAVPPVTSDSSVPSLEVPISDSLPTSPEVLSSAQKALPTPQEMAEKIIEQVEVAADQLFPLEPKVPAVPLESSNSSFDQDNVRPPEKTDTSKQTNPHSHQLVHRDPIPFPGCSVAGPEGPQLQTREFHEKRPPTGLLISLNQVAANDPATYRLFYLLVTSISLRAQTIASYNIHQIHHYEQSLRRRIHRRLNSRDEAVLRDLDLIPRLATKARQELAMAQPSLKYPHAHGIANARMDLSINYELRPLENEVRTRPWHPLDINSDEAKEAIHQWHSETDSLRKALRRQVAAVSAVSSSAPMLARWSARQSDTPDTAKLRAKLQLLRDRHAFKYYAYLAVLPVLRSLTTAQPNDHELRYIFQHSKNVSQTIFHLEEKRQVRLAQGDRFEYSDIEVLDYLPVVNTFIRGREAEICPQLVSLNYHRANRDYRYMVPILATAMTLFAILPTPLALTTGVGLVGYDYHYLSNLRDTIQNGTLMGITADSLVYDTSQIRGVDNAIQEHILLAVLQFLPIHIVGQLFRQ